MKNLIIAKDYEAIKTALQNNPSLANEGIALDKANSTKAHPLHRICDAVYAGILSDDEAVKIAELLLNYGANVNGDTPAEKKDTPLIAAASLHADKVATLYIEKGADIHHAGCHGGTALHWAAWCGRPALVKRLIKEGAAINQLCIDFKSTPLFWAVHGLKNDGYNDMKSCVESVRALLQAGADKTLPNIDGKTPVELLSEDEEELKDLLS